RTMNAARSKAVVRDHVSAASFAAAIARFASSREPCGTAAIGSPVAGDSATKVSPLSASVHRPATNMRASVAKLGPPPVDERLQLLLQRRLQLRLLVLLERLPPDVRRARGGILAAVARPALVVLGRREQRPVEALAEPLERVRRAEEVTALPHLLMRGVRKRLLVDLQRLEHLVQHAQELHVDDELLVAGDEPGL